MRRSTSGIRVLAIVPDAFGGHGGIALYLSDLIEATASFEQVNEVVVLTRNPIPSEAILPDKVNLRSRAAGRSGLIASLIRLLAFDRDFQLIVCGHINFLPVAGLAKAATHAEVMLMIYGIDAWNAPISRFANWLVKREMTVASISRHTRELFCRWSGRVPGEVLILPNAVHLEKYGVGPLCEELSHRYQLAGKKVMLTLGRLSAQERYKGIDEVIDVLPELLRHESNLVYLVAGEGDDRPRLSRLVEEKGLQEFVRFTGLISENEKSAHYQAADVFVLPGRGEGFGFVFLEAMACGVPVVASKLDGSREAVRNGELGWLVDPDDREELLSAILEAINSPKRIPAGLKYFSFDNFAGRLRRAYSTMGVLTA